AAGADLDGEIGEHHEPETHLIPLAIATALGMRESLDVYGSDYPTPDGSALRDYVHVADLATAHVQALNYLRAGGDSTALNLGTGVGHSVREVISAVESIAEKRILTSDKPRRPGDPPALVADATLARQILGWIPCHSELDVIVQTAYRWQAQLNDSRRAGSIIGLS
ncbi:MAG: UDP-glucose 4-epimerase, partial [Burkholderiales bacterium]|nr:UDP-glucose 4-epimerase [Burkholderiales bacterium]